MEGFSRRQSLVEVSRLLKSLVTSLGGEGLIDNEWKVTSMNGQRQREKREREREREREDAPSLEAFS
jgi:hypothetical protein